MKKFLSLVLALVMTMSLVTISAGAEDFTDDSKITYEEAVDVMSAVGVVGGYADGSFNPTGTLTRGAAAKIICNMILGPTTAEALSANDAPYKDVPADHVFAGYIAYCANEGIISGYADGTFRPAGTLTGYAFMKMLLGALGYDAAIEGYTGANWSIQVAKRALNIGLNKGLEGDFIGTKALTREEACLYAFNTMKADMVKYNNKSTIVVGDITVTTNADASTISSSNNKVAANSKLQFAEEYFEDLQKVTNDQHDAYGRPAHTWKNGKTKIGTYTDTADYVVVLDKAYTTQAKLVEYVLDNSNDDLNADAAIAAGVWYNGDEDVSVASNLGKAQAGAVIELFVGDDDIVDEIVAYDYTLAEIKSVSSKVSAAAAKKGATTSIKLEYEGGATATKYDEYDNTPANVLAGFDADTYVKGAKIVVVKTSTGKIIDSAIAETVVGKITSKSTTSATIDGEKYTMAGTRTIGTIDFKEEYTLYLDPNGYVLDCAGDDTTDLNDVYYVTGIYKDTDNKSNTAYYAEVVSLAGETSDVVIADTADFTNDAVSSWKVIGGLYTLTLNSDDKYEAVAFTSADLDFDVNEVASLAKDVKADAASATFASKTYFVEPTQFMSIKTTDTNSSVKEVKNAEGGMSMKAGVKAIAITKEGKTDALYVIYVGAGVSATVNTDDVVFVTKVSETVDSADTYLTDVVFMADNAEDAITVKTDSAKAVGFYTYAINDKGQYELTSLAQKTGTKVDEDWSGWTNILFQKSGIHNTTVSYKDGSAELEDVVFAGATVVDLRDQDALSGYKYQRAIVDTDDIVDAADSNDVHARVYVTDGVITFIAISDALNK